MRRLLVALLVGATAAALTLAAAGELPVNSAGLGTGQASAGPCDPGGVGVSWSTGTDPALGYTVASVTVTGIDTAACNGLPLSVSLTDPGNQRLGGGGPVTVNAASMAVPVSGTVPAAPVARVHVLIG